MWGAKCWGGHCGLEKVVENCDITTKITVAGTAMRRCQGLERQKEGHTTQCGEPEKCNVEAEEKGGQSQLSGGVR